MTSVNFIWQRSLQRDQISTRDTTPTKRWTQQQELWRCSRQGPGNAGCAHGWVWLSLVPTGWGCCSVPRVSVGDTSGQQSRADRNGWKTGSPLCKTITNPLLQAWDHLPLSFDFTGAALQRGGGYFEMINLLRCGIKYKVMTYTLLIITTQMSRSPYQPLERVLRQMSPLHPCSKQCGRVSCTCHCTELCQGSALC